MKTSFQQRQEDLGAMHTHVGHNHPPENPTGTGGLTTERESLSGYGCGGCENRWGGLATAHCAACHRTFTGIHAFDRHRAGSHPADTRHCVDPASVGLIDAGRGYHCWGDARTWAGPTK